MRAWARNRAVAAATATAAAAASSLYAFNEDIVRKRAARLERLQCCTDLQRRVAADDTVAQHSMATPIIVTGLMDAWPAMQPGGARSWTFGNLRRRMGHTLVDAGSSTGGVPFYLVAHNATSPSPGRHDLALYVFDSNFEGDADYESLLEDWLPLPCIAGGDVFASERAREHEDRPSWRWLLAGPPGSGTPLHQDPWGYSSWNASCVGVKRWVLFPPTVPYATLNPPRQDLLSRAIRWLTGVEPPRSAAAFMDEVLPVLRERGLGHIELLQHPGEVVAFPAGWWHAVVNLTPTIAVTESFGRPCDLETVLRRLREKGLTVFAEEVEAGQQDVLASRPLVDPEVSVG